MIGKAIRRPQRATRMLPIPRLESEVLMSSAQVGFQLSEIAVAVYCGGLGSRTSRVWRRLACRLATVAALAALHAGLCAAPADDKPTHEMVLIPAGEFVMGTSAEEAQTLAAQYGVHPTLFQGEAPRRNVAVKAFWIDRCPVTNAQYKRFIEATSHHAPFGWQGRECPPKIGDHPVTCVGWQDADAYARWAGLRLPTEAEWERAARGTDGRLYPWGNEWREDATRIDNLAWPQTRALTTPVGSFPAGASPYGVMDMCGNVAEWTCTPSQSPNPSLGWAWYVVKGAGAPLGQRYNFRCSARNFSAHTSRWHSWLGFRCVRDASETDTPPPQPPVSAARPAVPPVPPVDGPRADVFGKQPITVEPTPGHAGVTLRVPYLPQGCFTSYVPEQATAEGLPLAWGTPHEGVRWQQNSDGSCEYTCVFTGKAHMRVSLLPGLDCVDFTIAIRNLTDKPLTGVFSNTCFNVHASPYFENPERDRSFVWTDAGATCMLEMPISVPSGEPLHNGWNVAAPNQDAPKGGDRVRYPFVFICSRDGGWVIAQAYADGTTVASNAHYSCLHARPRWPDIPPGEERSVLGKYYFLKGGPSELLTRWTKDFGR